jgi:hypothetical protein
MHSFLSVLAVVVLAGCPGPGEGGGNDPAELPGSWREVPDPSGENEETLELRADGTYTRDSGGLETGTYTADRETLTLTDDTGRIDEFPYAVEGDQLLAIAMSRSGAGTGAFIGAWHADGTEDGEPQSIDLDLRADGSATFEFPVEGSTMTLEGTWVDQTTSITASFVFDFDGQPIPVEFQLHALRGHLGAPLFDRQ